MANTILTPTVILREAGRLFHQKARFLNSIDRSYDDRFAQSGAKVGNTIALRDPVQVTVGSGATMIVQDITETSQNLTVGTQKHVGMNFGAAELTMSIDDFSKRYLEKAIARLAAELESTYLTTAYKAVANLVDGDGAAFTFSHAAQAKQKLDENLAPEDDSRHLLLCPTHSTKYLVDTKGLLVPGSKIGAQYTDGVVKDALGFSVSSSTHMGNHQTGTALATAVYLADYPGKVQEGAAIHIDTGATTFKAGDVIYFESVNAVHPETKKDLGYLKPFSVVEDFSGEGDIKISPAIVASGAYQNVTAGVVDGKGVTKGGGGASAVMVQSLAYHSDAFVFATADLENPSKYGAWGDVQVMDNLSMRIWRAGDILNDKFPCRIDVYSGFLARYPQLACRIHADGA